MRNNTCLVCKKPYQSNQKTKCSVCKLHAHRRCANIGLNFGVFNYTCVVCHQKMGQHQNSPPSHIEGQSDNLNPNGSSGSADPTTQNELGTSAQSHCLNLDTLNDKISVATQNNVLIGPAETADLYLSINNLNAVLQNKTAKDIFVIHFNAVSWVKNFDSFMSLFDRMNHCPDVICVTETRLKDSKIHWQKNLVAIENYDLKYDNSPSDAGGVAVYLKNGAFKKALH